MKAPEKIRIVTISKASNGLFGTWTTRQCVGHLYISKEALLEWLKKQIKNDSLVACHLSNLAYQDVIDKLNEYEN